MPKEFIHCRDFGRTVPLAIDGDPDGKIELAELDQTAVKIAWSREGEHVELAVVESEGGVFIEHGWEQPYPRYIQLDRAGINRLITTLRRARDAAYGKDA